MWFTDPSDPATIAVLLVEAALLVLALAAALGVLLCPVRWLARCLAASSVLVALAGFGEVVWEFWIFRYPLVLPEAAFGTYAQPTVVGLALLLLVSVIVAVAGVLAFWRPGLAGLLFVASAMTFVPSVVAPGVDFPAGTSSVVLAAFMLPLLDVGMLLLATWWAGRRDVPSFPRYASRDASVPNPRG
ncbi:MAG TPA: hypothetical protein VGJ60_27215 [Chloroflexota bacterium]|jgi:hypothetical protein